MSSTILRFDLTKKDHNLDVTDIMLGLENLQDGSVGSPASIQAVVKKYLPQSLEVPNANYWVSIRPQAGSSSFEVRLDSRTYYAIFAAVITRKEAQEIAGSLFQLIDPAPSQKEQSSYQVASTRTVAQSPMDSAAAKKEKRRARDTLTTQMRPTSVQALSTTTHTQQDNHYDIPDIHGIKNGGPQGKDSNTCFLNAAFQFVMNDRELLKALVETYHVKLMTPGLSENKCTAYVAFLAAVEAYRAGKKDEIDLTPLRLLLDEDDLARKPGMQGDVSEVIAKLLGDVDVSKYPNLYFNQILEEKLVPYQPSDEERVSLENDVKEMQAKDLRRSADWRESYNVFPTNGISKSSQPGYSFNLTLESPETNGATLVNQLFQETKKQGQVRANFATQNDRQNGRLSWYKSLTEKATLQALPKRLMINLKRFQTDVTGQRTSKITKSIQMQEEMTLHLPGLSPQKYRLKSIVVHEGEVTGGHYYAFVKKSGKLWEKANDSSHKESTASELKHGLDNGYLYCYEKVES